MPGETCLQQPSRYEDGSALHCQVQGESPVLIYRLTRSTSHSRILHHETEIQQDIGWARRMLYDFPSTRSAFFDSIRIYPGHRRTTSKITSMYIRRNCEEANGTTFERRRKQRDGKLHFRVVYEKCMELGCLIWATSIMKACTGV